MAKNSHQQGKAKNNGAPAAAKTPAKTAATKEKGVKNSETKENRES